MTNLRSLLPLEATDGGRWTKIRLPCGCWEHLLTYLAVSCMGGSYIFLLGRRQFVFFLPKGESEAPGVHPLAPFGFWVCTVIVGFWVPFWPWASAALMESTSKGTCSAGPWSRCLWQKPTLEGKKLFPNCTNFRNAALACQSQLPTHPISCATLFSGGESSGWEVKKNLDFVPTSALVLSLLPIACPICSSVCPPGKGPSAASPEIKATVLGGTSDHCYNIDIVSGHEPVCKVLFFILSRLFYHFSKEQKS